MKISVRSYVINGGDQFKRPFHSQMGGEAFRNYNLDKASTVLLRYAELANEIIHSSQIMVVHGKPKIADGLFIASDLNLEKRLLHLTIDEFASVVRDVLDDKISASVDCWDWKTGEVHSRRG